MKGVTKREENTIVSLLNFKVSLCSCSAQSAPEKIAPGQSGCTCESLQLSPSLHQSAHLKFVPHSLLQTIMVDTTVGLHNASKTDGIRHSSEAWHSEILFQQPLLYPPQMCQDMIGGTKRVGLLTGYVQINWNNVWHFNLFWWLYKYLPINIYKCLQSSHLFSVSMVAIYKYLYHSRL